MNNPLHFNTHRTYNPMGVAQHSFNYNHLASITMLLYLSCTQKWLFSPLNGQFAIISGNVNLTIYFTYVTFVTLVEICLLKRGVRILSSLNLRDFPPELLKALKMRALEQDKTLRNLCVELLGKGLENE